MKMMSVFLIKQRARETLKGNWQTALLVVFLSGLFVTIADVWQQVSLADVNSVIGSLTSALNALPQSGNWTSRQTAELTQLYTHLFQALGRVPSTAWIGMIAVNVLSILLTPALSVSANRYFICRDQGEELGLKEGLLSRLPIWGRVMRLYILIAVKTLLWSLLFVIPGVIAAIRYSMAPYYLAEHPELTAREALQKSKEAMKGNKTNFLLLRVSFVGWSILLDLAQLLLGSLLGTVITLVAAQFMSLTLNTYISASCASFYCAVCHPNGEERLVETLRDRMRAAGLKEEDFFRQDEHKNDSDTDQPDE